MPQNIEPANSGELSPVKRALGAIRRLRAELEENRRARRELIAILGMALRLPGGVTTPERFWQALADGEDLIEPVPADRWEAAAYLHADPDHPGTMYDAHGGFLADVDAFDAEFFAINPREAASLDPQQRLLLELAWEALERAAIDPKTLANTLTGVYLGISGSDYGRLLTRDLRDIHAYSSVGGALSITAGRISYFLRLRGPSLVVDTACSSSLVAVQLAAESLRRGETSLAIVGGANLILSPDFNVGFARTRIMSRDGRIKTFDAAADGYVRSEACCVLVLKRLSDAVRDGDRVLASIAGLAVNQDGRSAGITAPNGPAQEAVIRAALENAGLEPAAVSYVEAHGTGTPLGDPIEVQALGAVYGATRDPDKRLRIGSVKANLGHTEAAAGLVSLIKVVLMMQPGHGIAPQLHFKNPNPKIDFDRFHIEVPTRLTPWPESEGPLYAGVSSFGFSGTNAHLVVASAPAAPPDAPAAPPNVRSPEEREALLVLSATSATALRTLAERYVSFLQETTERFADICFTSAVGRSAFAHRLALRARSPHAAAAMLAQWLRGDAVPGLAEGVVEPCERESASRVEDGDAIEWWQREYLRGAELRGRMPAPPGANPRRVELPVYPFARTRFWFEPAPQEKRAQQREQTWRAAVAEAERESLQGPLGWKVDRDAEKWAALDRLTLAHARNVFAGVGLFQPPASLDLEEVMTQGGFQPVYRHLVGRWLSGLTAANVLQEEAGRFKTAVPLTPVLLEPYWREAERLLEDEPGALAYFKQCGSLLGDVLAGRTNALEALSPERSFALAEALHQTGAAARYFNSIVAVAVADVARSIGERRNARVLEIGGGIGGTTSAILPLLPGGRVEYWFTDLSELFLKRARSKFNVYSFMHYAIFDLDRALEEQGIGGGQFDVIVGGNVVYASRNVEAALARLRRLLAPGGLLALLESTHHHISLDMTIGLIEGWQHFEDHDRQGHPLLNVEQWQRVLGRAGFAEAAFFPAKDSPATILGQLVLLARPAAVERGRARSLLAPQSLPEWKPQTAAVSEANAETNVAAALRALSPRDREQAMLNFVRTTIRRVFNLHVRPEELNARDRLSDLGMDSLIALELRSELVKGLGAGTGVSSTIAFDTGTVGELAHALLLSIDPEADGVLVESAQPGAELRPVWRRRSTHAPITAEQLNEMSEDEVEQLLNQRLGRRLGRQ